VRGTKRCGLRMTNQELEAKKGMEKISIMRRLAISGQRWETEGRGGSKGKGWWGVGGRPWCKKHPFVAVVEFVGPKPKHEIICNLEKKKTRKGREEEMPSDSVKCRLP